MNLSDVGPDGRSDLPLSVVVITENEQDRIAGCLESVIAAARRAVPSFEVILVDSASTDRTMQIAGDYPVTILQIPADETVSCGAGRYVGDQVARGDLVLHVDGDMHLTEAWLSEAVDSLRTDPDVVAVEGWLNESQADHITEVQKVGGVMCYDSDTLAAVGGFDPYLYGYEDVYVGHRLTAAGHRLIRLPSVSAEHPTGEGTLTEPLRRWRHGYLFAPGQAIRESLSQPRVLQLLIARQRYKFILLAWLALCLASVSSLLLFAGWAVVSAVGFAVMIDHMGLRDAVQFGFANALGLVGLIYGFGLPLSPADEFPLDSVTCIQEGVVFDSTTEVDARVSK